MKDKKKRLNLELSEKEHKALKRNALREDKTIRAYVRERLFPEYRYPGIKPDLVIIDEVSHEG